MAADFHRMSDRKGPTATLFKIKDNQQLVGGFTSAQWTSPEKGTDVTDSTAMLFNLTTRCTFKSQKHDEAIHCYKDSGPYFGLGELITDDLPVDEDNNCCSNVNEAGYRIGKDSKGRNMLTNLVCEYGYCYSEFTISELEVWEIVFEK